MKDIRILVAALLLPAVASAQYLDPRSRAMGGTGVASSHYASAGFLNPALLSNSKASDSFGLVFPSFGLTLVDEDGLVEAIDDFQKLADNVGAILDNPASTAGQRAAGVVALNQSLNNLNNKRAGLEVGAGLALVFPNHDGLSWAIVAQSYGDGQVTARVDAGDTARIAAANNSADLNNLLSEGIVTGTAVTEVGLAFAHAFGSDDVTVGIGVMPKAQRIDTYNYSVNVRTFDEDNYDDSQFRNDTTEFNIDAGASVTISMVTIGLAGRNLIAHSVDTRTINGRQLRNSYIEPVLTAGVALTGSAGTLAVDLDLTETDRFSRSSDPQFNLNDETQALRLGGELNLGSWFHLRGGYRTDLDDTLGDIYSAGIGISPGFFALDLTGLIGEGDTYGVALQTVFTF